jgi:calcineurin-like phosphoesterase family protein
MNEEIIKRWNSRVGKGDVIWHLGDFASTTKSAQGIFARLNGEKRLVTGNIDGEAVRALAWLSVQAYAEFNHRGCGACTMPLSLSNLEWSSSWRNQPSWS